MYITAYTKKYNYSELMSITYTFIVNFIILFFLMKLLAKFHFYHQISYNANNN